jgi:aminoglycoside/choline kinase family phosphotransferase
VQEISLNRTQLAWCNAEFKQRFFEGGWRLSPLQVEASHRHFYRVAPKVSSGPSLVLMASPPDLERNEQFVALQSVFSTHHVPVPEIRAQNDELGLYLLTDLGQTDLEACYSTELQDAAIQTAIKMLHLIAPIRDSALEDYDEARLRMELSLFEEWFLAGLLEHPEFQLPADAIEQLVAAVQMQPKSCVHRDYHCRNLLYHDGQLGIVDFQDALIGAAFYDLASLLHDCYHAFNTDDIDKWLAYFLSGSARFDHLEHRVARRMLDFTAIQRQLKAIGIFARLQLRDQKSSHLTYISPLLRRMVKLLAGYPELAPLQMQLSSCINLADKVLSQ